MNPIQLPFTLKKTSWVKIWRASYELEPARQAKRKEADATGPQGGYGIRLALSSGIEQKECQRLLSYSIFISYWKQ